mmetsp:Transcript_15978/g.24866  ORF Transcript_15978/g.24866 Transcript_15978/m.24866 type:complete len:142 (+) Transcript_15978:93-518(+)
MVLKRSCHRFQTKQWAASSPLLLWCTAAALFEFEPSAAFIHTEIMMFRAVSMRASCPHSLSRTTSCASAVFSSRQSSSSSSSQLPNTLDKKSLQLALLSLIQDERFLDLIHAQYLKVASSRAQREQQQQQQNGTSTQGDTK